MEISMFFGGVAYNSKVDNSGARTVLTSQHSSAISESERFYPSVKLPRAAFECRVRTQ